MTTCNTILKIFRLVYPFSYHIHNVESNLQLIKTAAYVQVRTTVQVGSVH